jgi:NADH-quinone oxidoreductase subunit E
MHLQPETLQKIQTLIPRYPTKRSAVLPILHLVQEEQGYISKEAIAWIAAQLDLQPIHVYELVTFYPMFRQKPIGKTHIKVCRTLSCALRGAYAVCNQLQEELQCPLEGTSQDGEFTIDFVECLASCYTAPVVQVDQELYHNITPDKVLDLIATLKEKNTQKFQQHSSY